MKYALLAVGALGAIPPLSHSTNPPTPTLPTSSVPESMTLVGGPGTLAALSGRRRK